MDDKNSPRRERLELVIQKKKLTEVFNWFNDHFVNSSREGYRSRCPFVIIQGPTGCGKTTTLKWISSELKVPIREYSETTDTTFNSYDISRAFGHEPPNSHNLSQTLERRKASKFEHFVINSTLYNPLYPTNNHLPQEADEFDSDDDFGEVGSQIPGVKRPPPLSGVIIHIESSLTFARNQRIFVQTLLKLIKTIKDLSMRNLRRVAIVFETLECEGEFLSIPNKLKTSIGLQTFKFNPIIKANMKKLIESVLKNFPQYIVDKETIEAIAMDSNGDMRACLNSLQLLCNKSSYCTTDSDRKIRYQPFQQITNKRQKLAHEKVKRFELDPSLMRDTTRSLPFFHVLGKIFYQKRYYDLKRVKHRSIDRPYPPENSTEYLVDMLDVEAKKLITWLHQHYYKFCNDYNIEKAAVFLENLSVVDTISIDSLQSSQFYELHSQVDIIQNYIAIESTVYSLYQDQSNHINAKDKQVPTMYGPRILKTSIDSATNNGELYSFNKPASLGLMRLTEDYKSLLDCLSNEIPVPYSARLDPNKILIDYIPYMNHMFANRQKRDPMAIDPALDRKSRLLEILNLKQVGEMDFDSRHEKLIEMIEDLEVS